YLDLMGAEARIDALRLAEADVEAVVRLTIAQAATGQGRAGDAERARTQALLLHAQEQRAEEDVAVASAELARLLDVDTAVRLRTPGGPIPLIQLFDPHANLPPLLEV